MLHLLPNFMSERGVTTLLNMCSSLLTSGTYSEIVRPSNSFQLAPLSEEFSWHFVQPSVRIHEIKSTVGAG